jgi:general secretion pathway protein A
VQPPASLKVLNDRIYEVFYGLTEQPFALSTDPKFLFMSASHQQAFDELVDGLERRESVLVVTGETGTGKTTLCRGVVEALGDRTVCSIQHQPYLVGADMLRLIVRDFGLLSHDELRKGAFSHVDVPQLVDVLERFLRTLIPLDSRAVLLLDEAQSLAPRLLDEIRMLTAFEHNGQRLVQIILCGQPGLLKTLGTEPLYALNERVSRRVALKPLTADEVADYIEHRITIAGGASAVSFSQEAVDIIAELSRGLPRRVNLLCDRALQEGRVESAGIITEELVKRAAKALAGAPEDRPRPKRVHAPPPELVVPLSAPLDLADTTPGPDDSPFGAMPAAGSAPDPERVAPEHIADVQPLSRDLKPMPSAFGTLFGSGDLSDEPVVELGRAEADLLREIGANAPRRMAWLPRWIAWTAAAILIIAAGAAGSYYLYARRMIAGGTQAVVVAGAPTKLPPLAEPPLPPTEEELKILMSTVIVQ